MMQDLGYHSTGPLWLTLEERRQLEALIKNAGETRMFTIRNVFLTGLICYREIDFHIPSNLQKELRPECVPESNIYHMNFE